MKRKYKFEKVVGKNKAIKNRRKEKYKRKRNESKYKKGYPENLTLWRTYG